LPAKLRLPALGTRAFYQPAFAMAQLLREAVGDHVDGLVKIVPVIFRMDIRSRQGQMNLDYKSVLERSLVVMPQRHMRADQVQSKMLQTFDFLGHVPMDGRCQLDITGADMNLHTSKLAAPEKDVDGGKKIAKNLARGVSIMIWYDEMGKNHTNTVTISPKYQVVIPKAVREQMNLQPGQKVRVLAYGDHLSFVPERPIKSMRGFLKGMDAAFERESDRL